MIKNLFKKNYTIATFVMYMVFLATIASRWITDAISIPPIITMGITVLQYLPFFAFALLKLVKDIQQKRFDLFNKLYYGFILYYVALTGYRFFANGVIKDNLYISIIFIGCLAFISLIADSKYDFISKKLNINITIISLLLIVYRLIFVLFIRDLITYSPVNEIAHGSMIMLFIPVTVKLIADCKDKPKFRVLQILILFSFLAIIFTLSSRVMFAVALVELAIVLLVLIINKKKAALLSTVIAITCAVLLIAGLFAINFGGVRYAVYREIGMVYVPSGDDGGVDEEAEKAQAQIQRSDAMRGELAKLSLEEIKKNPIFSTGKTFFNYVTNDGYVFNVPAHNFILTAINCYGVVGLLLIMAMFIALLLKHKLFCFKKGNLFINLLIWSVIIIFFGIGVVQASVFDILVMPTFCIAMGGLINQRDNKKIKE